MIRDFFTSDLHYGHKTLLNHEGGREFPSLAKMETTLTEEWNAAVDPSDRVYILGDFSFYSAKETSHILRNLNGQKFLVKGNHDHRADCAAAVGWQEVTHYKELRLENHGESIHEYVMLSHFPMLSWHKMHYGSYMLHGHCHNNLRYPAELKNARIMDVGVDHAFKITGHYRPLEWSEIRQFLHGRNAHTSVDHHKPKSLPPAEPDSNVISDRWTSVI